MKQIRIASANANGEKNNTSTLHAAPGIAGGRGTKLVSVCVCVCVRERERERGKERERGRGKGGPGGSGDC